MRPTFSFFDLTSSDPLTVSNVVSRSQDDCERGMQNRSRLVQSIGRGDCAGFGPVNDEVDLGLALEKAFPKVVPLSRGDDQCHDRLCLKLAITVR